MPDDVRQSILNAADDLAGQLLWYDRKDDEDLPRGVVEQALRDGVVTVADIVGAFENALRRNLPR